MYFQLMHNLSYVRKRFKSEKYLRRDENKILLCHECAQGCICVCMYMCVTLANAAAVYISS